MEYGLPPVRFMGIVRYKSEPRDSERPDPGFGNAPVSETGGAEN
jgi:hypothetical protein